MNELAKKTALKMVPYGLYVIGVRNGDEIGAFTGSWLSQCSFKPPLVMIGVRADSNGFRILRQGRVLTVNFLDPSDQDLASQFFKAQPVQAGKIGDIPFRPGKTGAPIIESCIAVLECEVREILEPGDHAVVVAEVIEAAVFNEKSRALACADTPWTYAG